jgi:hypothetical protein
VPTRIAIPERKEKKIGMIRIIQAIITMKVMIK